MKKIGLFSQIVLFMLVLAGCNSTTMDSNLRIVSPNNNQMLITGIWMLESGFNRDFTPMSEEETKIWNLKQVQFSNNAVVIGNELFNNPSFKLKKVSTSDYLLFRHKQPAEKYGIIDEEIYVITISAENLYSNEAILTSDGRLIVEYDDYILNLKRTSNRVDEDFINKLKEESTPDDVNTSEYEYPASTGLAVTLKSGLEGNYQYRTLFIGSKAKKLEPVLEMEGIFFPRNDGFWRLECHRVVSGNRTEDLFYAYNVNNGKTEIANNLVINEEKWGKKVGTISRSINYIGYDYIVFESKGTGKNLENNEAWSESRFQVQLVDNLPTLKGVKISDLTSEAGDQAMRNGRTALVDEQLKLSWYTIQNSEKEDENFGLYRKAGHWLLTGRLNYKTKTAYKWADYNINIIPPEALVRYDELKVSWTQIKDKVPEAIDAYASINNDIVLIVTKDRLLIYKIIKEELDNAPMKRIALKNDEKVIMAEWKNGMNMINWQKTFSKNNALQLVDVK
jgi:hypothetical protein